MAAHGKNIQLFLMDGDAAGRIKCTLANWTGVAFKIPRTELDKCKDRDDLKQSGVYFLFGTSDETGKKVVYIGQAGARKNMPREYFLSIGFTRLEAHLSRQIVPVVFCFTTNLLLSVKDNKIYVNLLFLPLDCTRYRFCMILSGQSPNGLQTEIQGLSKERRQ